ncbi:hypothetical protein LCGC14_1353620 [marine sediment metagenome]|uniref:Uncharacterized protein n=1 Tax=marine sediment metagenome TaxID=412755 RepID=A0A0F9MQT0_9ZZZZ
MNTITISEFIQEGYLQEVNRQFFHPLGLALEVKIDEETGECSLGNIWDCREDPEGIVFGKFPAEEVIRKAKNIANVHKCLSKSRYKILGYTIQPIADIIVK